MPTRRELMERAEARLRARGGEEGALEASRCFLRAMLASIDEQAQVPDDLVTRVGEFLKVDLGDRPQPALRRQSTRPPPSSFPLQAAPGERRRRVLFLGRQDGARVAMFDAVARAILIDDADVRAASLTPVATDPRALGALRHAGYATDQLSPRAVTVDDLTWADLVVTFGGDRAEWDRYIPRSTPHQHELIDDPVALARSLSGVDELEPFQLSLRSVERAVTVLRPPRSSRMPTVPPARGGSWSRMAAVREDEPPQSQLPSSARPRQK